MHLTQLASHRNLQTFQKGACKIKDLFFSIMCGGQPWYACRNIVNTVPFHLPPYYLKVKHALVMQRVLLHRSYSMFHNVQGCLWYAFDLLALNYSRKVVANIPKFKSLFRLRSSSLEQSNWVLRCAAALFTTTDAGKKRSRFIHSPRQGMVVVCLLR